MAPRPRLIAGAVGFLALMGVTGMAGAVEFDPFRSQAVDRDRGDYFAEAGAPTLGIDSKCNDEDECWPVIRNGQGEVLREYGTEDVALTLAGARYRDRAYLLAKLLPEDDSTRVFLIDNTGDATSVDTAFTRHFDQGGPLSLGDSDTPALRDLNVTPEENLLALTAEGLLTITPAGEVTDRRPTPATLTHGRIQNDLDGRQAVIGVDTNNEVWLSNGQQWHRSGVRLAERGDRAGVLAAHPAPDGTTLGVVYRYVNPFHKGLYVMRAGPGLERPQGGPVLLSTERNVGFDPAIHPTDKGYMLLATDSSNDQRIQVEVPKDRLGNLPRPEAGSFPDKEWWTTFWAGGGVQYLGWQANSRVKARGHGAGTRGDNPLDLLFSSLGGETLLEVDYQIDRSLLWSGHFQGRIGDTRLALTYLREEVREEAKDRASGQAATEAADYLIGSIDFEGLFSPSSGLRVGFRRSRTRGLAKLIDRQNDTVTFEPFEVDYRQYSLYHTGERGIYWGLEYSRYQMPTAVGFSDDSKDVVHTAFDPEFGIRKYALVLGYDAMAYAKRYEVDYRDWFVSGQAGFGLGKADLSQAVKSNAKQATGTSKIQTPLLATMEGVAEAGFVWQKRYRTARGLGFQAIVSYQARGSYLSAGRGQEEEAEDPDELALEVSRWDIWHGPFARLNVIF